MFTQDDKPWHVDSRLKPDASQIENYTLLQASAEDIQKVIQYYTHHPVSGYDIKAVEIIYNPTMDSRFTDRMKLLQERNANPAFAPRWQNENNPEWREKVHQEWQSLAFPYQDEGYPAIKLLPGWNEVAPEILESIFKIGYANTTNSGFFGRGIYSALEAEYAYRIHGKGALILNWIASYSAYPVIHGDTSKLLGKGNFGNYDAHFAPVALVDPSINYYPPESPHIPAPYHEIVVFDSAQCLPRYLVTLQPTLSSVPSLSLSEVTQVLLGSEKATVATPNKEIKLSKTWHFDSSLKPNASQIKNYKLLQAAAEDIKKVIQHYIHHPVAGYDIKTIEIIYNPTMDSSFADKMKLLQERNANPDYASKWQNENNSDWRKKVHQKWQSLAFPYPDSDYPAVKLLPGWHGTAPEILDSIFKTGYANLATTDSGFFGKGIYSSHEAEYAHRVYSKGALILNWIASYSAYPVIQGDMNKLTGKNNFENYDTHFAPVVPKNPYNPKEVNYYPPATSKMTAQYHEIVVFDSAQCLPRYLVTLQPTLPGVPRLSPVELSKALLASLPTNTVSKTIKPANALPPIPSGLLPHTPYFIGRENLMSELNTAFTQEGLVTMCIQGLAGCGKSQLAAEYAHQSGYHQPYQLIRWLKADSAENLKNAYFALGEDLGIERKDYKDDEEAFNKAINCQLLRYERVLLIYDNVESLDDIIPYQPQTDKNTTHLLVATRNRLPGPKTIMVPEFTGKEIQTYLEQRLQKNIPLDQAEQLGQELGYLPLAVVQATVYMIRFKQTALSLLQLLQTENRQTVLESSNSKTTVATLWNLTLEKLSPEALEVMQLCAYLDPDNIPKVLLEKFLAENEREEVLFELCSQSLLIETGNEKEVFRVHRLLQEAVRRQLLLQDEDNSLAKTLIEKGTQSLKEIIGKESDDYLFWKTRGTIALQINRLITEYEKLKLNSVLLGDLFEWSGNYEELVALNYAKSLIQYQNSLAIRKATYGDNHPDVATSLNNIGFVYKIQGQYDKALSYYEQSLSIRNATYGDNHPDIATSLNNIGVVYKSQSQYDKALKYFEQSLSILKAIYGGNHPNVAKSLNNIGSVYDSHGQYNKALKYYEQALTIDNALYGNNHPDVATSLNKIGFIYNAQGQYDRALKYFEQSLSILKAIHGDNHPNVAESFGCIGSVYDSRGQYNKALKCYEQALSINKAIYGDNHFSVAAISTAIGSVYDSQGQYNKALKYYEHALNVNKTIHSGNHPHIAINFGCIGSVYYKQGQYDKALSYYEQALSIYKAIYGDNHPLVATSLNNISVVYKSQGQYDKALKYCEQALSIYKAIHGDNHPLVATSLNNIGNVYDSQGQYDKALKYYEQALSIDKVIHGDNHPLVATSLNNIGNVYDSQGQYDKALKYFEQALSIRKVIYGDYHPDVATSLACIGSVCDSQGQYDKALSYYEQSLSIRKAIYGDNHPDVAKNFNNIGVVYNSQGQYDKALNYYEQALSIRKAIYGDYHPDVAKSFNNIGIVYDSQSQYDKALKYYEQTLSIYKAIYGDNHPKTIQTFKAIDAILAKKSSAAIALALSGLGFATPQAEADSSEKNNLKSATSQNKFKNNPEPLLFSNPSGNRSIQPENNDSRKEQNCIIS